MATHSLVKWVATACSRRYGLDSGFVSVWAMLLSGIRARWAGTALLLAANLAGFVGFCLVGGWPYALGFGEVGEMQSYYDRYGTLPLAWTIAGRPLWPGWLTTMFVHTGPLHAAVNCFWILMFGRHYGWGAPLMYLWGGLAASAAYALASPHSAVPAVGASAALSALLGGMLTLGRLDPAGFVFGKLRIPGAVLVGCFAAVLFVQGLEQRWDVLGLHLVGVAAGAAAGFGMQVWEK